MSLEKITTQQMDAKGVCAAPDVLSGTPAQNKAVFDRMVRELITPAYNAAVDAVNALEETESGIEAAEALRVAAEELRAAAETARAEAESGRAEAEQQRQDAETQRQDLETGYVARSENGAKASESWAVGGTGTREGEDTNNAKYWSEQAAAAAGGGVTSFKGRTGSVIPASGDYTAEMVGAYSKEETDTLLQKKADASSVYTREESISADTRTALSLPETATPDAALAEIARQLSVILHPQIIVTAPTGSTVTCKKGTKTITATEVEGTWTFTVDEYGAWTVECLNGLLKSTENVLVDTVAQYEVEIGFKVWLFKDGDQCEDITGGWTSDGCLYSSGRPLASCSISGGNLVLPPTAYPPVAVISTVNRIDMTRYSVLKYESTQSSNGCSFQIATDKGAIAATNVLGLAEDNLPVGSNIISTIDISALTESAYPCISRGSTAATTYVSKVWLE